LPSPHGLFPRRSGHVQRLVRRGCYLKWPVSAV
jgi:hypothetical protein